MVVAGFMDRLNIACQKYRSVAGRTCETVCWAGFVVPELTGAVLQQCQ